MQRLVGDVDRHAGLVFEPLVQPAEQGAAPGPASPDPELTARTISAVADESARLMLTHPRRYSIDRLTRHAGWVLDQLDG